MKPDNPFNDISESQESQYNFPYHYIPSFYGGRFKQHLYWSWGINYLSALSLVLDIVREQEFETLIDIGCGDGRFLKEVYQAAPMKRLLGIDVSKRAINLANSLNPEIQYDQHDISTGNPFEQYFDVAVLIEVLEHIPTVDLSRFVSGVSTFQKPGGRLIVTVPHINKPKQPKHFQHFNSLSIKSLFEPYYKIEQIIFFEKLTSIRKKILEKILENSIFILNNSYLLTLIYNIYNKHLFLCGENKCGRICVIGRKK